MIGTLTYSAGVRLWRRLHINQTKSAGGDPRRPRRLRRCANQDHSRGRNYTSNRGGHATFNGCVRLDKSGTRPLVETVLPMLPCVPHRRMCTTLGRFSRDGDFDGRRGLYIKEVQPQDARSIKFFQDRPLPCTKHVGATATNFRGGATNRNLSRED